VNTEYNDNKIISTLNLNENIAKTTHQILVLQLYFIFYYYVVEITAWPQENIENYWLWFVTAYTNNSSNYTMQWKRLLKQDPKTQHCSLGPNSISWIKAPLTLVYKLGFGVSFAAIWKASISGKILTKDPNQILHVAQFSKATEKLQFNLKLYPEISWSQLGLEKGWALSQVSQVVRLDQS